MQILPTYGIYLRFDSRITITWQDNETKRLYERDQYRAMPRIFSQPNWILMQLHRGWRWGIY